MGKAVVYCFVLCVVVGSAVYCRVAGYDEGVVDFVFLWLLVIVSKCA